MKRKYIKTVSCAPYNNKEVDIDINFKLWPCCYYLNNYAEYGKTGDPYVDNLPEDWNDLTKHDIDDILNHRVFTKHLTPVSWSQTAKCSPLCWEHCGEGDDFEGDNLYDISEHNDNTGRLD